MLASRIVSGEEPARGSNVRHAADVNADGNVTAKTLADHQLAESTVKRRVHQRPSDAARPTGRRMPDPDDRRDVSLAAVPLSEELDPIIDQSPSSNWAEAVDQAMQISDDQATDEPDETLLLDLLSQSSIF